MDGEAGEGQGVRYGSSMGTRQASEGSRPGEGQPVGEVLLGTEGFGYDRWVGVFYPRGVASRDYLTEYARRFRLVELDTTYYRTPTPALVERWAAATPPGFRFAAKVPRTITFEQKLAGADGELDAFFAALRRFGEKLGPILFQMSPSFRYPADWPALRLALAEMPDDLELAMEFRHRSWWRDDVEAALAEHNVAWVLNDLPYLPRATETPEFLRVTAPFSYIRLQGNHEAPITQDRVLFDREADLDDWASLIDALRRDLRRVYVLANNHYQGHGPATLRALALRLGIPLVEPDEASGDGWEQPSLLPASGAADERQGAERASPDAAPG